MSNRFPFETAPKDRPIAAWDAEGSVYAVIYEGVRADGPWIGGNHHFYGRFKDGELVSWAEIPE